MLIVLDMFLTQYALDAAVNDMKNIEERNPLVRDAHARGALPALAAGVMLALHLFGVVMRKAAKMTPNALFLTCWRVVMVTAGVVYFVACVNNILVILAVI